MRIEIDERIRADHDEVRGLILEGFRGVGRDGVEVQVVANRSRGTFAGRAWPEPPRSRPLADGGRFLVEIVMPRRPSEQGFPFTWRYPGMKTAPQLSARDWRERLIAVAAHEAYHVKQFRRGMRRSEVAAERWAARALERLRDR